MINQLALIIDGSYLRHHKSKNYDNQKNNDYGNHILSQKASLMNMFTICTTDEVLVLHLTQ